MPLSRSLQELQVIDNELARIRRERAHLDDGSAPRAEASTLAKAISAAEDKLNQINHARGDKEEELKAREAKLTTQQQRLMNAKSAHEVNSLQRDIEGITKSRGELDEAILTYMEEIEGCTAQLDALRSQFEEQSTRLAVVEEQFHRDVARLDGELKHELIRREEAAARLSDDEKEHYESSAKKHGGVAVCWNEKGNCSACGMMLTPYNLKAAKAEEWPQCESCGRLLFAE